VREALFASIIPISIIRISNMSTPSEIRPTVNGVLETALVVEDVARATRFYKELFGFDVLVETERLCSLSVIPAQVLLLFQRGGSLDNIQLPGGVLPGGMDAQGRSHMAFAIAAEHVETWSQWLKQKAVVIESTLRWERGGTSIHFRDPDGNLLELATPGVWANY
jgi:catechol 2,3-dioxygenase-like lactoylglutathione lyase family enzyme